MEKRSKRVVFDMSSSAVVKIPSGPGRVLLQILHRTKSVRVVRSIRQVAVFRTDIFVKLVALANFRCQVRVGDAQSSAYSR